MLTPNIDTDAIIPVEQMKNLDADLGSCVFFNHRYRGDGTEDPDFVLNRPRYRNAKILLTGANFGCGSSREHAVWALLSFGIRCVIAPSFGEIFYNNCFKNGLLPVQLTPELVSALAAEVESTASAFPQQLFIDLASCTVRSTHGLVIPFEIDAARRQALLNGLDEISTTLEHETEISAFQAHDKVRRPWIYRNW